MFKRHRSAASEREFRVTPFTSQVTTSCSHKNTRQSGVARFALNAFVDLADSHDTTQHSSPLRVSGRAPLALMIASGMGKARRNHAELLPILTDYFRLSDRTSQPGEWRTITKTNRSANALGPEIMLNSSIPSLTRTGCKYEI